VERGESMLAKLRIQWIMEPSMPFYVIRFR